MFVTLYAQRHKSPHTEMNPNGWQMYLAFHLHSEAHSSNFWARGQLFCFLSIDCRTKFRRSGRPHIHRSLLCRSLILVYTNSFRFLWDGILVKDCVNKSAEVGEGEQRNREIGNACVCGVWQKRRKRRAMQRAAKWRSRKTRRTAISKASFPSPFSRRRQKREGERERERERKRSWWMGRSERQAKQLQQQHGAELIWQNDNSDATEALDWKRVLLFSV